MNWTALFWKEIREQVRPAGKWSGLFIMASIMGVVFGAAGAIGAGVLQYNLGPLLPQGWPLPLLPTLLGLGGTSFAATLLPMNSGVDSVAGERERHTLETLLAGPLPDKEIVWAKSSAIAVVSCMASVAGGVALLVTLPILYAWEGLLWGLLVVVAAPLLPLIPSFATACTSILISMRSKTVKDAGQRLSLVVLPMSMLPGAFIFAIQSPTALVVVAVLAGVFFLALAVVAPILAFVLFRRDRLILS